MELALRRAANEREALPDQRQIGRIEFLRLDQDLLSHTHLAEVVQQPGILDLAQLLAGEPHVGVGSVGCAVHGLGQRNRHGGDTAGVTERSWIALLDGRDGSLYETLEQALDVLVQL